MLNERKNKRNSIHEKTKNQEKQVNVYKSQVEFFEDKFHAILFYFTFQRKALTVKLRLQRSHFFNAYAK
jgi:hypothetical protein